MPTPLLIKPTIEEIRFAAEKLGMPQTEADKFFYHYESNGWKVGRVKMASVNGALAGWKLRWQERLADRLPAPKSAQQSFEDGILKRINNGL